MNIPYRTRRLLQRLGVTALAVLLVAALVLFFWFVWLQRYVIYTRSEGAIIDLDAPQDWVGGVLAVPPEQAEKIPIYYNEGENALNVTRELTQIVGYYADQAALQKGIDDVLSQALSLPRGTPVMLDVKNTKGAFFYSSTVSEERNAKIDPLQMDELIKQLDKNGNYLIARLPALRDYYYAVDHTKDGLPTSKGYLWVDRTGGGYYYWLNPAKEGAQNFLIQIINELKSLGFDEVVLDQFCFPDTKEIVFSGDKTEELNKAANTLVTVGSTETFTVSFVGRSSDLVLPDGRSRLYLEGINAANAALVAESSGVTDVSSRLVFLTEVHDTRFDDYSVLRPLEAAH